MLLTAYAPHVGMAFGAIGGMVARPQMDSRGETLRQLMAAQNLMIDVTLTEAFRRERPAGATWVLWTDSGPGIPDYETLITQPAETAAVLTQAAEQVASAVVRDMRR